MNMANAAAMIRHSVDSVISTGVGLSLIELLKTVQHWPALIDTTDTVEFSPQFNATEICAEEVTKDDETVIRVSFSYSGERYDFTAKIKAGPTTEQTIGNIVLHENGDWVINMDIVKTQVNDHFSFRDLNAFRNGPWMDKILGIALEIESNEV